MAFVSLLGINALNCIDLYFYFFYVLDILKFIIHLCQHLMFTDHLHIHIFISPVESSF